MPSGDPRGALERAGDGPAFLFVPPRVFASQAPTRVGGDVAFSVDHGLGRGRKAFALCCGFYRVAPGARALRFVAEWRAATETFDDDQYCLSGVSGTVPPFPPSEHDPSLSLSLPQARGERALRPPRPPERPRDTRHSVATRRAVSFTLSLSLSLSGKRRDAHPSSFICTQRGNARGRARRSYADFQRCNARHPPAGATRPTVWHPWLDAPVDVKLAVWRPVLRDLELGDDAVLREFYRARRSLVLDLAELSRCQAGTPPQTPAPPAPPQAAVRGYK